MQRRVWCQRTRKFDRITSVLQNLYWLPVAKASRTRWWCWSTSVWTGECRLIWLMFASPSTHYQDVDSSVLLPLVSCWSPGQVPTSADVGSTVVDQLRGTPCQSLYVPTTDLLRQLSFLFRPILYSSSQGNTPCEFPQHTTGVVNLVGPLHVVDNAEFTTLDGHCHRRGRQLREFHRLSLLSTTTQN